MPRPDPTLDVRDQQQPCSNPCPLWACLTGKVRSGCRDPLCERDVVPEAFELSDEALDQIAA
jgi:hypothetical protein